MPTWLMVFNEPNAYGKFSELQSKAILCHEGRPQTEADTPMALRETYPDFTSFIIDFEDELCTLWQPNSAAKQAFEPVVSDVPVLILSGEFDPVCPPIFGDITSRTLPNSVFINVPSASHAAIHLDDCIRNMSVDFLSDPQSKPTQDCVGHLPKIHFATSDLSSILSELSKK